MTKRVALFANTLVICLTTGCAGNPTQEAALLLVDEIDNYQASVAAKVDAEQTFYKDIRETLKKAAERQAWVEKRVETRNRITELADRAIIREKGLQVSVLQQFLRDENVFARQAKAAELARKTEIQSNYVVSFEALTVKQQELSAARSKLLTLAQDRDASKILFEHIRKAAAMAQQLEDQAKAQNEDTGANDGDES